MKSNNKQIFNAPAFHDSAGMVRRVMQWENYSTPMLKVIPHQA